MKLKIASIANYLAAGLALFFGLVYLIKSSFMSYHAEAISLEWTQLQPSLRFLILAFMRVEAGCFLVTAITLFFLQYKFTKERISWISWLLFLIGTVAYSCTLYSTFIIKLNTTGNPPILLAELGLGMVILAFVLNESEVRTKPRSSTFSS